MAHYKITLAYDGTTFAGFQHQKDRKTVQAVFEYALRQLGWRGKRILASGRTDTGVHALGQVIAVELDWTRSSQTLREALNAFVPRELSVVHVEECHPEFHPRYDAKSRRYAYQIYESDVRDPIKDKHAWWVKPPVEWIMLERTARLLVGIHDFAAFGRPPKPGGSAVRQVFTASWRREVGVISGETLIFEICANAFLYRMVRRLVATQMAVASGKIGLEEFSRSLDQQAPFKVNGLAPPQGLVLMEVCY